MTLLEIVAVAVTLLCVWMVVKQNMWTWPLGLVAVTLYGVLFYREKLYADMGLQAVYFAFNLYGWYEWLWGGEGHTRLKVSKTPRAIFLLLLVIGALLSIVIGWSLSRHTDAAAPLLDSTLTSYSLVAQFLMTRKWIENWHLWITVDIAYVYLFITRKLYLTAGLYAVFIILATMGLIEWKRSYDEDRGATTTALPDVEPGNASSG